MHINKIMNKSLTPQSGDREVLEIYINRNNYICLKIKTQNKSLTVNGGGNLNG